MKMDRKYVFQFIALLGFTLLDLVTAYNRKFTYPLPDYVCGQFEHMCKDGTCVSDFDDCENHSGNLCSKDERYCTARGCLTRNDHTDLCSLYCGKCHDGSLTCSEDGKTCPGICPIHKTMCNGTCIEGDSCEIKPCTEYICDDGRCYSAAMRCDGFSFCDDKSDERGCAYPNRHLPDQPDGDMKGHSKLYMVALVLCVVFVTLFSVCITVFKRSRADMATSSGGYNDFPDESHFTDSRIEMVRITDSPPAGAESPEQSEAPLTPSAPPPYDEAVDEEKYPPPANTSETPPKYTDS